MFTHKSRGKTPTLTVTTSKTLITILWGIFTSMTDPDYQQPEDNEALQYWMWCEEQKEKERNNEDENKN